MPGKTKNKPRGVTAVQADTIPEDPDPLKPQNGDLRKMLAAQETATTQACWQAITQVLAQHERTLVVDLQAVVDSDGYTRHVPQIMLVMAPPQLEQP